MNNATWQSVRLKEPATIQTFLERDRGYAAYAIGDLEPGLYERTSWYGAGTGGELRTLTLLYTGLQPAALFLMGDSAGLPLILGSMVRERLVYATCREEHLPVLEAYYVLGRIDPMYRMVLDPERFRPDRYGQAERLLPTHIPELQELFLDGGAQVIAFSPEQVLRGVFYGLRVQGRLVAVAGTHLVAQSMGIAAVGNVFTHPDFRGRGFGSICTSQVTEHLLARRLLVVLNVHQQNESALRIYRRLGYAVHGPFLEMPATRHTSL